MSRPLAVAVQCQIAPPILAGFVAIAGALEAGCKIEMCIRMAWIQANDRAQTGDGFGETSFFLLHVGEVVPGVGKSRIKLGRGAKARCSVLRLLQGATDVAEVEMCLGPVRRGRKRALIGIGSLLQELLLFELPATRKPRLGPRTRDPDRSV